MISPKEFINPEHSVLRKTIDTLLILAALGGYKLFPSPNLTTSEEIRADIKLHMDKREQEINTAMHDLNENVSLAKDALGKIFKGKK
jgi:hypothetical protein